VHLLYEARSPELQEHQSLANNPMPCGAFLKTSLMSSNTSINPFKTMPSRHRRNLYLSLDHYWDIILAAQSVRPQSGDPTGAASTRATVKKVALAVPPCPQDDGLDEANEKS